MTIVTGHNSSWMAIKIFSYIPMLPLFFFPTLMCIVRQKCTHLFIVYGIFTHITWYKCKYRIFTCNKYSKWKHSINVMLISQFSDIPLPYCITKKHFHYLLCSCTCESGHKVCIWSLFTKSAYRYPPGCMLFLLRYSKVRAFARQRRKEREEIKMIMHKYSKNIGLHIEFTLLIT